MIDQPSLHGDGGLVSTNRSAVESNTFKVPDAVSSTLGSEDARLTHNASLLKALGGVAPKSLERKLIQRSRPILVFVITPSLHFQTVSGLQP